MIILRHVAKNSWLGRHIPKTIVRYGTLRGCMAAYFGCRESQVRKQRGFWTWADATGRRHRCSAAKTINEAVKDGCWGWLEDKKKAHVWISTRARPAAVVYLLAHEIGHACPPHKRDSAHEETKACRYGIVAVAAADLARVFLKPKARRR